MLLAALGRMLSRLFVHSEQVGAEVNRSMLLGRPHNGLGERLDALRREGGGGPGPPEGIMRAEEKREQEGGEETGRTTSTQWRTPHMIPHFGGIDLEG